MSHALPGTEGIPIFDIFKFFRKELQNEDIMMRANSIAFSYFLSVFPLILFLISLLPYLPIENFVELLEVEILVYFPVSASDIIISTIDSLTLVEREGLLSISILMALFFSSNGMITMMESFDKNYEISYKSRNFFQKRGTAILLTVLLASMLVTSVVLIVFGRNILDSLLHFAHLDKFSVNAFLIMRWFIIIGLIYTGIALIYHRGPALKKRLKFRSAGASVATFLIILSSLGFSFFVNQFNTYNKVYGSIGALIIILVLFQINSLIILIGYELNASIAVNRDMKEYREKIKSASPAETGDVEAS
jgi:membrane protein